MADVGDSNPYQKFGSFYAEPTAMTALKLAGTHVLFRILSGIATHFLKRYLHLRVSRSTSGTPREN